MPQVEGDRERKGETEMETRDGNKVKKKEKSQVGKRIMNSIVWRVVVVPRREFVVIL